MTFNQLVWKMAKRNKGKYIFYYLCNSFAVMFFFMFSTIYFNEKIVAVKELEGIQDALTVPGVALVLFTVFFINYAHRIFTRRRRKEFGLFMTLGMSNRDISKLQLLENGVIALISILSGILAGAVFSRLFFLLLMNSVGMGKIPFQLTLEMFTHSIGAFLIVFLISVGITLYLTLSRTIIHSLRSDRISDSIKLRSPVLGGIGVAIVIGSALLLYATYMSKGGDTGYYLLFWTISILMGLYIALSQCMSFFIEVIKKHKPFYYRRLLVLSGLEYKFKQLTAILMLVTVMGMVTIFYSTLLLFIYTSSEKQITERYPFDVAFVETEIKNNLSTEELYSIVDKPGNPVKEHLTIPLFDYFEAVIHCDCYYRYTFMPLSDFNKVTGNNKVVEDGEYLYYINDEPDNGYSNSDYNDGLKLGGANETLVYTLKETIVEKKINYLPYVYADYLIVNDSEFENLKTRLTGYEASMHLINFTDWKATTQTVEKLEKRLDDHNLTSVTPENYLRTRYLSEEGVSSKIGSYNYNRNSNGIVFFVSTFISVLFFFGTFILLYLNIFSNIREEKEKYKKLFKIGITKNEIKHIISRELMVLFFFAPLLGSGLAFVYVVTFAQDVGGIMQNPFFVLNFLLIAGIYLAIQTAYYFLARRKMLKLLVA